MADVSVAVLAGTALAVAFTIFGLRWMHRRCFRDLPAANTRNVAKSFSLVLVAVTFPFAWWLGFILGGNFGGATAALMTGHIRRDAGLIQLGIGLGIALTTAAICLAVAGLCLLVQRLFRN